VDRLREALSARDDGYWELAAASAGAPSALERVRAGLTGEELERGARGDAIAPSVVRERVEAVAACDPRMLIEIAGGWGAPVELGDRPFFAAAFGAALRHLAAHGAITRSAITRSEVAGSEVAGSRVAVDPELEAEVEILWPLARDIEARRWRDLVDAHRRAAHVPFDRIRALARVPLVDRALGVNDVADAPWAMLRALRGREHLLDPSARAHLREVASGLSPDADPFDAAVLVEIASRVDPELLAIVRDAFVARLPGEPDARAVIPLVYVLLGNGWVVP
jgi:hypothetical protein